jgi:hypothetical protein
LDFSKRENQILKLAIAENQKLIGSNAVEPINPAIIDMK